jgi:hypothetical protein
MFLLRHAYAYSAMPMFYSAMPMVYSAMPMGYSAMPIKKSAMPAGYSAMPMKPKFRHHFASRAIDTRLLKAKNPPLALRAATRRLRAK